ncbi:unnamed protein product [Phyllotreta striolata]|uniref:Large ribosomal subunit protein mL64 n=1 Tax=Phyllotreta striolata TaxID=444603 RepID=A0A9N9TMZ2_PHYSR|nr:unnamed protein product [Phyllotreta striolata]
MFSRCSRKYYLNYSIYLSIDSKMIRNKLITNYLQLQQKIIYNSHYFSTKVDIAKLDEEPSATTEVDNEEAKLREEEIERLRNKSRLRQPDRCILMNKNPYPEPMVSHHGTLKYMRRTYGRYGEASGVNPAICWPVKEELDNAKEYERAAHPFTIQDMMAEAARVKKEKEEATQTRQKDIVTKMLKLEEWKRDLANRIAKKEAEAIAAKQKKERLVEEVKRHFGYTVDPRDAKFQEMLEQKEKEEKKAKKEERKKLREAKMMEKLLKKPESKTEKSEQNKEGTENTKEELPDKKE